jgi:hypothetical protein
MTVVNLKVLAELDWSVLTFVLPLLLGAAMLLLLAIACTTTEKAPRVALAPLPATLPTAQPVMQWHRRVFPRACGVSRAPPHLPQPRLATTGVRIVARC